MFKSFFPNSRWFWLSAVVWAAVCIFIWYQFNINLGALLGLDLTNTQPVIGLGHFFTDSFKLFYLYYALAIGLFGLFWFQYKPGRWLWWSLIGSGVILFSTYFSVQVSVAINNWRRPFFDAIQKALSPESNVTSEQLYGLLITFAEIAFVAIFVLVLTRFFTSHYIFRWRTAMNEYYTEKWAELRHIEGASQRVQEDTMRFATMMEKLGVPLVEAVMTLFAFLPVLWELSKYVTELPIIGQIASPLFYASILWSIFGTLLLTIVGIKLPGLEFKNQRVEAAYRKELVYGEDDENRAEPLTLKDLFTNVRKNYFKLYFHYMYFNVARYLYIQADNIFVFVLLVPTIIAGKITFGILQQILTAFSQVSESFQYLIKSWYDIVEMLSIHKRLQSFEATLNHEALPEIDRAP